MERSNFSELKNKNLVAYVNRQREALLQKLYWMQFFGLKATSQLTWANLSGTGGAPVMADVVAYNASAPLKTRRTVTKLTGDIPKITLKRQMDEKDLNDYNIFKAMANDSMKNELLKLVFDDVKFCYVGVQARTEFLCLQGMSYGTIALSTSNNNGFVTETAVDIGIPSGNKTAVGTIWATAATATPIADIKTVVEAARAAGHIISNITMDLATFNLLALTTEAKNTFAAFRGYSSSTKQHLMLDDINLYLRGHLLPPISIVNSAVRHEDLAHAMTNVAPWKSGYVAFNTSKQVGKVLHGPIAEENNAAIKKVAIMSKKDHVLISKWSTMDPAGEWTKGQANAFPTFADVDAMYILKTDATAWA